MRVAFLTPAYGPELGGVGRHVQELARGVAAAGGEAVVLAHEPLRHRPADELDGAIRILRFTPPVIRGTDYAMSPALWSHLRAHVRDFDLLHVHGSRSLPAMLVTHAVPRRLIFSPHYHLVKQTRIRRALHGPYRRLGRTTMLAADRVLCISHAEAALVSADVPAVVDRLRIVTPGVDAASIAAAPPLAGPGTTIVTVGRLEAGNRVDRVIATLPHLGPEYTLVVIGDGPSRGALEAYAADLAVRDQVRFAGSLPDDTMFRWLAGADVAVRLPESSMWGAALLEAHAANTPVIANDQPAHRETADVVGGAGITLLPPEASPLRLAHEIEKTVREAVPFATSPSLPSWSGAARETVALYESVIRTQATIRAA